MTESRWNERPQLTSTTYATTGVSRSSAFTTRPQARGQAQARRELRGPSSRALPPNSVKRSTAGGSRAACPKVRLERKEQDAKQDCADDGNCDDPWVRLLIEVVAGYHLKSPKENSFGGKSFRRKRDKGPHLGSFGEEESSARINPYCVAKLNNKTVHVTQPISRSASPVWAIDKGSLFLLRLRLSDLRGKASPKLKDEKDAIDISERIPLVKASSWRDEPNDQQHDAKRNLLTFHMKSKSTDGLVFGENKVILGSVAVDPGKLLDLCTEDRYEFPLTASSPLSPAEPFSDTLLEEKGDAGNLVLRFRVATKKDIDFVQALYGRVGNNTLDPVPSIPRSVGGLAAIIDPTSSDEAAANCAGSPSRTQLQWRSSKAIVPLITEMDETDVAQQTVSKALSSALSMKNIVGAADENGIPRRRVKPGPDPTRRKSTKWMTEEQIKTETDGHSLKWTQAGHERGRESKSLGKVYLEVIKCNGLPNMDAGPSPVGSTNLTDAFVCAVYEDVAVQTPVIDDELSPHWLPWTRRAFIFERFHPDSNLYLAVFDYDLGPVGGHDPIGRVAVNLCNFTHNTVYTLTYSLYPSSSVTERVAAGTITIRLRIEAEDQRAVLLAGLRPPPRIHVNARKEKSFKVIQYTCFGEYNEEKFDMTVLRSYINEIFEYKSMATYAIGDAFKSVIFWRGQVKVGEGHVPLHSFLVFYLSINAVERPRLLLPLFFFSIAWFMLANMGSRNSHPSPWNKCRSFLHYCKVLADGNCDEASVPIRRQQNWKEAAAYEEGWKRRIQRDQELAQKRWELQQRLNAIGNEKIKTEVPTGLAGGLVEIQLLERMDRWQGYLGGFCRFLRKLKLVLTWEESVLSFWFTIGCLALGAAFLILPWPFLFQFFGRILVWVFLGPWMKLVDILLIEDTEDTDHMMRGMVEGFHEKSRIARVKREDALKLKAVKTASFGRFITLVPPLNLARHFDRPLPESVAVPVHSVPDASALIGGDIDPDGLVPGQQLYGAMVPRIEEEAQMNRKLSLKARDALRGELNPKALKSSTNRSSDCYTSTLTQKEIKVSVKSEAGRSDHANKPADAQVRHCRPANEVQGLNELSTSSTSYDCSHASHATSYSGSRYDDYQIPEEEGVEIVPLVFDEEYDAAGGESREDAESELGPLPSSRGSITSPSSFPPTPARKVHIDLYAEEPEISSLYRSSDSVYMAFTRKGNR